MATRVGQEITKRLALRRIWNDGGARNELFQGVYFSDASPPLCFEVRTIPGGLREIWRLTRAEVRSKAADFFTGRVAAIDTQIAALQTRRAEVIAEGQRVRDLFQELFT